MIKELIKNLNLMLEVMGEEMADDELNQMFSDCPVESLEELNGNIKSELICPDCKKTINKCKCG